LATIRQFYRDHTTVRFAPEFGCGGGIGEKARHSFVFFERNGLRRLEVDQQWAESSKTPSKDAKGRTTWLQSQMMFCSSYSNIPATFLRDSDGDTCEWLYRPSNYL
jgi:hypothetical protein